MSFRHSLLILLVAAPLGAQRPARPAPAPVPADAPLPPLPPAAPLPPLAPMPPLPAIEAFQFDAAIASRVATTVGSAFASAFSEAYDGALTGTLTTARAFNRAARSSFAEMPPAPWAQSDPADSLYRAAREQLNRGDYRRAVALFKEVAQKFPYSQYASEAPYWQAFSLYRIGGTPELQEALTALETQRTKYPSARTQGDANTLATRIAGVLSGRGVNNALVKQYLNTPAAGCDPEDQSVRAEALNALMQTDADAATQLSRKILARKDECSADLRRSAVFLVGDKRDAAAAATLIAVAKSDPSIEVRADAISWLSKMPGDDALNTLEELARSADDERIQRAAVRALTTHPNPRARLGIRALVERNDAAEKLRMAALDVFDRDRSTAEDAAWMRGLYPKVDNPRIKARIASAIGRIGGDANDQWLLGLARNEDESLDVRNSALRYAGRTMDIASLGKFYDGTSQRQLREQLIDLFGSRKENEATDKLIDIVRTGTDPQLRRSAISALTRKKDPRTTKLLLEIIDK